MPHPSHVLKSWPPGLQNVTVFGQRDFKDAIKENEVIWVVPKPVGLMFLFEEKVEHRCVCTQGEEEPVKTKGDDGHLQVKESGQSEIKPADPLISDF